MSKKTKRIIPVLLIVFAVIAVFAFKPDTLGMKASAETSGTCGDNLTWEYDDSTCTLTISGSGTMTDYRYSSYGDGFATTAPWRQYCSSVRTIVISEGVTGIGSCAFHSCTALTKIYYNAVNVVDLNLGSNVFNDAGTIENGISVVFGDSVEYIPAYLFNAYDIIYDTHAPKITSVTFGNSVTSIGENAFGGCAEIKDISIPDNVTSMGMNAFRDCSGLESITIGNSVSSIGSSAFYGCTSLESVSLGNGVKSIGTYAFEGCFSLTSIIIPNSVTSIGYGVFKDCTGLTEITIPPSVTSIGSNAFYGCTGLEQLTFNAVNCPDISKYSDWLDGCTSLTDVVIGNNVTRIPDYLLYNCSNISNVTIYNSTSSIGENSIPYSIKIIGYSSSTAENYARSHGNTFEAILHEHHIDTDNDGVCDTCAAVLRGICGDNLTWEYDDSTCTLTISGTGEMYAYDYGWRQYDDNGEDRWVTTAPWKWHCNTIKNVVIATGVTNIGSSAFTGCGFTSVTISGSVTSIGYGAFKDCTGLTSITIPYGVTSIGGGAFEDCTGLEEITIPDSVTNIHSLAFFCCKKLAKLYYTGTVADWCNMDFDSYLSDDYSLYIGGTLLTEISGEDLLNISKIKDYTFRGCNSLTSVTIPENVTSVGEEAFCECINLENIVISEGVETIGEYAFSGCPISSIVIPESLQKIDAMAFFGCWALKSIEYNAVNCTLDTIEGTHGVQYYVNPFFTCLVENITIGRNVECIPAYMFGGIVTFNYQKYNIRVLSHDFSIRQDCLETIYYTDSETNEWRTDMDSMFFRRDDIQAELTDIYHGDLSNYERATFAEANIINEHTFDSGTVTKEATCKEEGTVVYTCECGYSYTETIPQTDDHDWKKIILAPDCTQEGEELYICRLCGLSKLEKIAPALNHSFTNYVYNNDATTEKDGTETAKCDRCDATYTRTKPGTKLNSKTSSNPTANAKINVAGATKLNYRTVVTIKATASNLDTAYHLVLVVNGKEYHGNNVEVSSDPFELTGDVNYYVKIVNSGNRIQKDASGAELKKDGGKIECNDGFFQKLIAFFQGLFNALPKETVKP